MFDKPGFDEPCLSCKSFSPCLLKGPLALARFLPLNRLRKANGKKSQGEKSGKRNAAPVAGRTPRDGHVDDLLSDDGFWLEKSGLNTGMHSTKVLDQTPSSLTSSYKMVVIFREGP